MTCFQRGTDLAWLPSVMHAALLLKETESLAWVVWTICVLSCSWEGRGSVSGVRRCRASCERDGRTGCAAGVGRSTHASGKAVQAAGRYVCAPSRVIGVVCVP